MKQKSTYQKEYEDLIALYGELYPQEDEKSPSDQTLRRRLLLTQICLRTVNPYSKRLRIRYVSEDDKRLQCVEFFVDGAFVVRIYLTDLQDLECLGRELGLLTKPGRYFRGATLEHALSVYTLLMFIQMLSRDEIKENHIGKFVLPSVWSGDWVDWYKGVLVKRAHTCDKADEDEELTNKQQTNNNKETKNE